MKIKTILLSLICLLFCGTAIAQTVQTRNYYQLAFGFYDGASSSIHFMFYIDVEVLGEIKPKFIEAGIPSATVKYSNGFTPSPANNVIVSYSKDLSPERLVITTWYNVEEYVPYYYTGNPRIGSFTTTLWPAGA